MVANAIFWMDYMSEPKNSADELAIFALSYMYSHHTIVYTHKATWTTMLVMANMCEDDVHNLCKTHLVFLGNGMYGELKEKL